MAPTASETLLVGLSMTASLLRNLRITFTFRGGGAAACPQALPPARVSTPLNSLSGMLAWTFRGGSGAIPLL